MKNRMLNLLGVFFLWPFASLCLALRDFGRKENRLIVHLFFILYGFTFVIATDFPDATRYAQQLKDISLLPAADFVETLKGLYSENGAVDLFQPFVTLFVSRFTSNHGVLFAVFAAVFGFFYLKSISLLYDQYLASKNINALVFLVFFAFIIPIFQINGVRFWTASWVFFCGASHFLVLKKKRYLFLALTSVLFHFSFLFVSAILVAYYFVGNRSLLYLGFVGVSFFIPDVLIKYGPDIGSFFGGSLERKIVSYSSESRVEHVAAATQAMMWYAVLPTKIAFYYLLAVCLFLKVKYRAVSKDKIIQGAYCFMLLLFACINSVRNVPSMGVRYQAVQLLFSFCFVILIFSKTNSKKWHWISIVSLIPLVLHAALQIRIGLPSLSPWLFAPMPFPLIGGEETVDQLYTFLFK